MPDRTDDSDERSLSTVLVIVGAVAVGMGAAAKHFGADATLGLIMVGLGISGLRRPSLAKMSVIKTRRSRQA